MEPLDPPPQFAPPVIASAVRCVSCGYDLSGTALGGACPECGASVAQSLRAGSATARTSGFAIGAFVCGLLSLVACGLIGIVAIALYFPAMKEVNAGLAGGPSKGFAIAGLVTGIIGTVFGTMCLGLMMLSNLNNW